MTDPTAAPSQSAQSPFEEFLAISAGFIRYQAFRTAAELEIADHLASGPLSVEDLASRTNTHAPSLFRLLRALESTGIFKQV